MFKVFPAIDIKDGKCVRLNKGDFSEIKIYNEDPVNQANNFARLGFKNLHMVDLDGALQGKSVNLNKLEKIIKTNNFSVQVGGGIRSLESIKKFVDIGVDKVILGTAAFENLNFLKQACNNFNNKIAVAIDTRNRKIALSGWKKQTDVDASDYIFKIKDFGVSRIIHTDIERDGTQNGPNIEETIQVAKKTKIPFLISGGIGSLEDIKEIKLKNEKNIEGVIVGKAIYEGKISFKDLIDYA